MSIIIPCYNYEKFILENINKIINRLKIFNIDYELILINDGSSDSTKEEIEKILDNKKISLINNKTNQGKSFSVISTLPQCKFENILMIDCDLPYFDYFEQVINEINKDYDLVVINRRLKESEIINKRLSSYQKTRSLIGSIIGFFINFFLKINVDGADTQAGLKAFKKTKNFDNIRFYSKKFFFDLELIHTYSKLNKKILSLPVKYEIPNESSIKILSLKNFYIIYELLKIISLLKLK